MANVTVTPCFVCVKLQQSGDAAESEPVVFSAINVCTQCRGAHCVTHSGGDGKITTPSICSECTATAAQVDMFSSENHATHFFIFLATSAMAIVMFSSKR